MHEASKQTWSGLLLNDPVEQLLRAGLQVEPHILVRLVACHRRDALHEIEDALCQGPDYAKLRYQVLAR